MFPPEREMPQRRKKGCLETSPILPETKGSNLASSAGKSCHRPFPRRRWRYEPIRRPSWRGWLFDPLAETNKIAERVDYTRLKHASRHRLETGLHVRIVL